MTICCCIVGPSMTSGIKMNLNDNHVIVSAVLAFVFGIKNKFIMTICYCNVGPSMNSGIKMNLS